MRKQERKNERSEGMKKKEKENWKLETYIPQ
jgi:hypothetical protein